MLKVSTEAATKNPDLIRFIPDHPKTKKCKNIPLKKLLFVIRYVPDRYRTQEMHNKTVAENGGTLKFVPDSYKN